MSVVGSVSVRVVPSFSGFNKSIAKGFVGASRQASRSGSQTGASFWRAANSAVSTGARAISRTVTSMFSYAGRGISRVATAIGRTFMRYVGSPIARGASTVGRAVASAFSSAGRWVGNAASTVGRVFMSALPSVVQRGAGRVGRAVAGAFSSAGRWVGRAASTVGNVFTNTVAPAIARGASRVSSAVGSAFSGVASIAGRVGTQASNAFSSALTGIGTRLTNLGPQISSLGTSFSNVGSQISGIGSTLTKSITVPVVGATGAVGGLVAALGFGRLVGVDTARAKLEGLGYAAGDVERISGMVSDAIEGTMITMAEGTNIAVGALASGVEEGEDLERYIRLVGDAANFANVPIEQMSEIFNRVQGSGKLMLGELNMLERQVPGSTAKLAESYGVSQEAFREMVSAGEVDSARFLDVMDDFLGGAGEAYAKSWAGLAKNTMAYVGIIGENILSGAFQQAKGELASFVEFLSSPAVQDWAADLGTKVGRVFAQIVSAVKSGITWWMNLDGAQRKLILSLGAVAVAAGPVFLVIGKFASALGAILQVAGPVTTWLGAMATRLGAWVASITGATSGAGALWTILSRLIVPIGIVVTVFTALWHASEDFRTSIINLGKNIWSSLVAAFQQLLPHIQGLWSALTELWSSLSGGGGVLSSIGTIVSWVVNAFSWLLGVAIRLAGFLLSGLVVALTGLVKGLTWVANIAGPVLGAALNWLTTTVFPALGAVAMWLWQNVMLPAWTGIKWGWDMLVQGISWAWTNILQPVFHTLGSVIGWLWTNIAVPAFAAIRAAFSALGTAISWAWANIIQPVFRALGSVIVWLWTNVALPYFGYVRGAWSRLGTAFSWVWQNILAPVFRAVGAIIRWLWQNVALPYFDAVKRAWRLLSNTFMWVWNNVLKQVFILVIDIIRFLWNSVARPLFSAIRSSWNGMASAMRWVWANILKPTWDRLVAVLRWMWNSVISPIFNWVRARWNNVLRAMQWAWRNILHPTWNFLMDVLRYLWNSVVRPVLGYIRDRWNWMTSAMRHIWSTYLRPMFQAVGDFIKNTYRNHIRPAFGWIRDRWNWLKDRLSAIWENGIKPVFKKTYEFVETEVVDRIEKGVEAIKLAWRKLKQWFASPIIWVIDTVWNNGIAKAFNTVADKIDSDARIPNISTKSLEKFRTGGAVSGPGTGTSDDIVARLSDGEHVLTAKEVKLLGGQDAVYDLRNRIKTGQPLSDDQKSRVVAANGRDFTASEQDRLISGKNSILPVGSPAGLNAKGSAKKKTNWDKVKEALGNTKDWVLGGLASMVGKVFDPLKKMAENKMGKYKSIGTLGLDLVKWGIDNVLGFTKDKDDEHNASMEGGAGGQGLSGMDAFLWALRQVESNNRYKATNPYSDASGAYQFISSTWGGYGGYRRAADAPPAVQDARARKDALMYYKQYGNWRQTAAAWLYPIAAGNPASWGMSPGAGNPSINSYVNKVMAAMKTAQAPKGGGGGSFTANPGGFNRPSSGRITSRFGRRAFTGYYGNMHYGMDIAAGTGAPVRAAWSGNVLAAGWGPGTQGNRISLTHGKTSTNYFHLSSIGVKSGQSVKGGQIIGREGGTPNVAPHLHFELHRSSRPGHPASTAVNPGYLFRDKGGLLPEGISTVLNKTGGAEYIFNEKQFDKLNSMAEKASGSGGAPGMTVHQYGMDYRDAPGVANELGRATRRASRNGRYPMGVGR